MIWSVHKTAWAVHQSCVLTIVHHTIILCYITAEVNSVAFSGDQFLVDFAKLRKATINFVMSVCPTVYPHGKTRLPLDRSSRDSYLSTFRKFVAKIQVSLNSDKSNGYSVHTDQYTLMVISRSVLHRMRNISDRVVEITKILIIY